MPCSLVYYRSIPTGEVGAMHNVARAMGGPATQAAVGLMVIVF
jgi:hypothetical protein